MNALLAWKNELIGIVLALPSFWLTLRTYRLQRDSTPKKAFAVGSQTREIYVASRNLPEEFEARLRGHLLERLTENRLFYMNTGNVEISSEDFMQGVKVTFPGTKQFFDCAVVEQHPPTLDAKVEVSGECIALEPLFLNKGDFIVIRFLRSGATTTKQITGRIKGISRIDMLLPGNYASWFTFYPITMIAASLMPIGMGIYSIQQKGLSAFPIALLPFLMGVFFLVTAIHHRIKYQWVREAAHMGKGTERLEYRPLVGEDSTLQTIINRTK